MGGGWFEQGEGGGVTQQESLCSTGWRLQRGDCCRRYLFTIGKADKGGNKGGEVSGGVQIHPNPHRPAVVRGGAAQSS